MYVIYDFSHMHMCRVGGKTVHYVKNETLTFIIVLYFVLCFGKFQKKSISIELSYYKLIVNSAPR